MPAPFIQLLIDNTPAEPRLVDRIRRIEVRESDEDPTIAACASSSHNSRRARSSHSTTICSRQGRSWGSSRLPGGLPQRLFEGIITHIRPHFETIESNCYLEILGMDSAVLLDAFERTASYDASDADAVTEILDRYNIRADVEDTPGATRPIINCWCSARRIGSS